MKIKNKLWREINFFLYKYAKIKQKNLRDILTLQFCLFSSIMLAGLILFPFYTDIFWLGSGAFLGFLNFLSLTKLAPRYIVQKYKLSIGIGLLIRSQIRLIFTVIIVCGLNIYADATLWALLLGLGFVLFSIVLTVLYTNKNNF